VNRNIDGLKAAQRQVQQERGVARMRCMSQNGNGKPNGRGAADHLSAAEIGRLAKISAQRVRVKLKQGKSAGQIIEEAEARRRKLLLRQLPAVPLDGTVMVDGMTFAQAQVRKEIALARIREAEFLKMTHELTPNKWIRDWSASFLVQARQALEWQIDQVAAEVVVESDLAKCREILARWTGGALERIHAMQVWFETQQPEGEA
jgi:hypothetical protein